MALNLGTLNIDIKANTTDAVNRLDTVRSSAQDLEQHDNITVKVNADTTGFNDALDKVKKTADELAGYSGSGSYSFSAGIEDNVTSGLNSIKEAANSAGEAMSGIDFSNFITGAATAIGSGSGLTNVLTGILTKVGPVGVVAAAGVGIIVKAFQDYNEELNATVTELKTGADSAATYVDTLNTISINTGLSTQFLDLYYSMQGITDVPIETLKNAVVRLNTEAGKALSGDEGAIKKFNDFGIQLTNSDGSLKTAEQLFDEVILKIQELPSEAEKSAALTKYFGEEAGKNMMPLVMGVDSYYRTLVKYTTDFNNDIDAAFNGDDGIMAKFNNLGVQLYNEDGTQKDKDTIFDEVIAKIRELEDEEAQWTALTAIFGPTAANYLLPFIANVGTATGALTGLANAYGTTLKTYELNIAQSLSDTKELYETVKNTADQISGLRIAGAEETLITAEMDKLAGYQAYIRGEIPYPEYLKIVGKSAVETVEATELEMAIAQEESLTDLAENAIETAAVLTSDLPVYKKLGAFGKLIGKAFTVGVGYDDNLHDKYYDETGSLIYNPAEGETDLRAYSPEEVLPYVEAGLKAGYWGTTGMATVTGNALDILTGVLNKTGVALSDITDEQWAKISDKAGNMESGLYNSDTYRNELEFLFSKWYIPEIEKPEDEEPTTKVEGDQVTDGGVKNEVTGDYIENQTINHNTYYTDDGSAYTGY